MIQTETFYINGVEFTRTYSDDNRYVVRDGAEYVEACDPAEYNRTYTEGKTMSASDTGSVDAEEILNVILGGSTD